MLHNWSIEPREYSRHEARRGRRHAFERIDPTTTALVVVDMVPFFVESNGYARGIVPNVKALAATLRSTGGVVVWVLPRADVASTWAVEFYGPTVADVYRRSGGEGPLRERLWHELDVAVDDLLVEKWAASAFFPGRCELHALLTDRKIETVLVAGTVANVCCESTIRDASTLGYRVVMVADANAAVRDEDLNASLRTVYRSFGDVRSTSELQSLVASGSPGGP